MKRNKIGLLSALTIAFLLVGCREVPTSVKVEGGPSFLLNGSGRLGIFTVYAPLERQKIAYPDAAVAKVAWQIRASAGYFKGSRVGGLRVTYGKTPDGYEQTTPGQPQTPPALQVGLVYGYFAESTDAPIATGYFYMDKSGPIQTNIPDLCITLVNGHKERVTCSLDRNEAYVEPKNLEEVVQQNRVGNR